MSTKAPDSGVQALPLTRLRLNFSLSGTPAFTAPVAESDRMSERFNFSSTKYGPSVSDGFTTQESCWTVVVAPGEGEASGEGEKSAGPITRARCGKLFAAA